MATTKLFFCWPTNRKTLVLYSSLSRRTWVVRLLYSCTGILFVVRLKRVLFDAVFHRFIKGLPLNASRKWFNLNNVTFSPDLPHVYMSVGVKERKRTSWMRKDEEKKRQVILCGIKLNGTFETLFLVSSLSLSFFLIAPGGPYDLSASNKEALTVFSVYTACAYDCMSHHKLYQRPQNAVPPSVKQPIALVTGKGVVNSDSIGQVQPVGDHAPVRSHFDSLTGGQQYEKLAFIWLILTLIPDDPFMVEPLSLSDNSPQT